MQRGLVQIYTGAGKGKTTAALGLALRALGAGLKVYLGQFIKKGEFSEIKALRRFKPKIVIRQYGCGRFVRGKPSPADIRNARKGLADLKRAMLGKKYDLVIADEINCAVNAGLISEEKILHLIKKKPPDVELVLTGRNAPSQIMKRADLITEMKKIRHPFDKGEDGRRGIEF
ncbi:MAG: cob(I)yrinic acid a,c-diamide adenosyltransferase [Kiritimatiellia bacterium]|nr:cob(I)yrinic acid a,c-diamide adenosyltransferase [Kiritimatiellia bacterium]